MLPPFSSPSAPSGPRGGTTLADFLARFDDVTTESDGYLVICPSHTDTRPSLRVAYNDVERKLAVKCRAGCQTTAVLSALGLSMADLFNVDPGEGIIAITAANNPGAPSGTDFSALSDYIASAAGALHTPDGASALDYLSARFGVTAPRAADLRLGFDDGSLSQPGLILSRSLYHDAPRVIVPLVDFSGRPQYLQGRALSDGARAKWSGPANPEGAAWGKYGIIPGGTGWSQVVITEGPGDGLTSSSVGYDSVVIRGAALFADNPALADEISEGLRGRVAVIAGDADEAGGRFTRQVAAALSTRGVDCRRLVIPADGGDDLTEWRKLAGATAFSRALVTAVQSAPRFGSDEITAEEISQELTRLFSDVHNARTLLATIHDQGADIRHTPEAGFIVYRPEVGVWAVDDAEWARSQAQTVAARVQSSILAQMSTMDARVAAIEDRDLQARVGQMLDSMRKKARSSALVSYVMSTRGIDSMLRELRALPGVFASYEDFDQHHHLLAVRNGVVNLETGALTEYGPTTRDLYLMRRVSVDYVPGARCPRWERFLTEIFADFPDLPGYMQRLIGYGITGHTTEQALAVFYGGGSNGKGVFLETLTGLLKGITVTTPFSTFELKPSGGIPNDIAALKGSRLVMASEGEQGRQMAESLIKRLTGGDTISARFMRKEFFEFTPTFLILLATNYRPNFRGQDFGLWRRVKLIPFTRTFTMADRDPHLTAKLLGRRVPDSAYRPGEDFGDGPAGILAWAVEGAMEWARNGLQPPDVVTSATDDFKANSDALRDFYAEYLVRDPDGRILGKDAWNLYQQWADEEGLPQKDRWKRSTFWAALEERGAVKRHPKGATSFNGIRKRRPSEHGRADSDQPTDLPFDLPSAPDADMH